MQPEDNPADVASTVISPKQLAACDVWCKEPHWLEKPPSHWIKPEQPELILVTTITDDENSLRLLRSFIFIYLYIAIYVSYEEDSLSHLTFPLIRKLLRMQRISVLQRATNVQNYKPYRSIKQKGDKTDRPI